MWGMFGVCRKSICPLCSSSIDFFCHCPSMALRADGKESEGFDSLMLPRGQGEELGCVNDR